MGCLPWQDLNDTVSVVERDLLRFSVSQSGRPLPSAGTCALPIRGGALLRLDSVRFGADASLRMGLGSLILCRVARAEALRRRSADDGPRDTPGAAAGRTVPDGVRLVVSPLATHWQRGSVPLKAIEWARRMVRWPSAHAAGHTCALQLRCTAWIGARTRCAQASCGQGFPSWHSGCRISLRLQPAPNPGGGGGSGGGGGGGGMVRRRFARGDFRSGSAGAVGQCTAAQNKAVCGAVVQIDPEAQRKARARDERVPLGALHSATQRHRCIRFLRVTVRATADGCRLCSTGLGQRAAER
jgi:hypothetical protein